MNPEGTRPKNQHRRRAHALIAAAQRGLPWVTDLVLDLIEDLVRAMRKAGKHQRKRHRCTEIEQGPYRVELDKRGRGKSPRYLVTLAGRPGFAVLWSPVDDCVGTVYPWEHR